MSPTVRSIVEARARYLANRIRPRTLSIYRVYFDDLVRKFGNRPANKIKAFQLEDWADRPTWNSTTQRYALGIVSGVFGWAARTERIAKNPLRDLIMPRAKRRGANALISEEAHCRLVEKASPRLASLLTFLWETGCRPGEATRLTAQDIDLENRIGVLNDHKTKDKTDKPRTIYLTDRATEILTGLMTEHPTGPLFVKHRGSQWTSNSLSEEFGRLCRRAGLTGLIIYGYRHSFATEALCRGVPDAQVAELLGHSGTQMLHRHYSHLLVRRDVLRGALLRVREVG